MVIPEDRSTPDTVTNAKARSDLGMCLLAKKQYAEAESHMLLAHKYLELGHKKKHKLITDEMMSVVNQRIEDLYEAWAQPEKTIEWRNKHPQVAKKRPQP